MTKIEWCDESWNPIIGCARVSEGCRHCYAERFAGRMSGPRQAYHGLVEKHDREWRWTNEIRFMQSRLEKPLRWRKPRRVFVNSMGDLFHEKVNWAVVNRVFAVMAAAPQHRFIILTKRPKIMQAYICNEAVPKLVRAVMLYDYGQEESRWPLPNVWLGVSVENQETATERLPILLDTPAAKHIVSAEPLLGPVDFSPWLSQRESISWLIVGGESGPGARPMHPDWARAIRDDCAAAGMPFFFKQWGVWRPVETDYTAWPSWFLLNRDGQLGSRGRHTPDRNHGEVPVIADGRSTRLLDGR